MTEPTEPDTKLKMVTTAEIVVRDRSGNIVEHIKIDQDGKEEKVE